MDRVNGYYYSDIEYMQLPRDRRPTEERQSAGPGDTGSDRMTNHTPSGTTVLEDHVHPSLRHALDKFGDGLDLPTEPTAPQDVDFDQFAEDVDRLRQEEHAEPRPLYIGQREGNAVDLEEEIGQHAALYNLHNHLPQHRGLAISQHQQVPQSPASPNANGRTAASARVRFEQQLRTRQGGQAPHHGMVAVDTSRRNMPPTESMSEIISDYSGYFSDESEQRPSISSPVAPNTGSTATDRAGSHRHTSASQSNAPAPVKEDTGPVHLYECTKCTKKKKTFRLPSELRKHDKNAHTPKEARPYECPICKDRYNWKGHLIRHENDCHSDLLPFQCEKCKEPFSRLYNKNRHEATCEGVIRRVRKRHRAPTAATSVSAAEQGVTEGSSVPPMMSFGPSAPGTTSTSDAMDVDGPEFSRYTLSSPTPAPRMYGKGK